MIASRSLRILPWCAALLSGQAAALGLGEINLHSRIGEPIHAEIPLFSAGERLDPGCFSLGAMPGSDIPAITAGRIRLARGSHGDRLIVTGRAPVNEPVFMINVIAACGYDLQREYTLLPLPPEPDAPVLSEAPPPRPEPAPRKKRRVRQAAPADEALRPAAAPGQPASEPAMAAAPRVEKRRPSRAAQASGKDKLVLGGALDELPPPAAGDPLAPVNALEERMLKMETTLHLINAQVDKLDAALALDAEARTMRRKLQAMQARQAASTFLPEAEATAPPPPPAHRDGSHDGWIELVLGILLGGSISATVAHLVSRRQDNARPFDAPPRIARPRQA